MAIKLHHQHPPILKKPELPLYLSSKYGTIQDYQNPLIVEEPGTFFLKGEVIGSELVSLPASPFGGVYASKLATEQQFSGFLAKTRNLLLKEGISSIKIIQPPAIYENFVPKSWMSSEGFETLYEESNQHLSLESSLSLHNMERRRIKKSIQSGMIFKELPLEEMPVLYDFLEKARMQQGLIINIEKNRFLRMVNALNDYYNGYAVFFQNTMIAGLVTAAVTNSITYYFLPGSDKQFNNYSPMAFLISELIKELRLKGISILDMGISSIKGEKQVGLFTFKKRMGAFATQKPTYKLPL